MRYIAQGYSRRMNGRLYPMSANAFSRSQGKSPSIAKLNTSLSPTRSRVVHFHRVDHIMFLLSEKLLRAVIISLRLCVNWLHSFIIFYFYTLCSSLFGIFIIAMALLGCLVSFLYFQMRYINVHSLFSYIFNFVHFPCWFCLQIQQIGFLSNLNMVLTLFLSRGPMKGSKTITVKKASILILIDTS